MFLRVQHFQQADRWTEQLVQSAVRDIQPHRWGVADIAFDRDLLHIGKFALSSCRGTMPDGTPFSIPDDTDHPPPLELTGSERGATVYLAIALAPAGRVRDRHRAGARMPARASSGVSMRRRTPMPAVSPTRRWKSGGRG